MVRNKLKRVIREAFRLERKLLPEGLDVVVIPKDGMRASRLGTARTALAELFPRLARRLSTGTAVG